ncbi:MAG: M23 family metallopeptidase [Hyphomonas sp.]|nr:M23 family metallopeptidase [Hyphomonas sp.]
MKRLRIVLISAVAAAGLGACDFIRFPGDGGPPPSVPDPEPDLPPGAPGPPPPSTPVEDPYGAGDTDTDVSVDEPTDTDTTGTDTADADTDPDVPADPGDTPVDTPPGDTPPDDTPVTPDPEPEPEPEVIPAKFSYFSPGALLPGTGTGAPDETVFAPDMLFPIKSSPSYLQSMVFTFGGGMVGGDQCDARNFEYPWRDNFCETRSANRGSPYCPVNKIHQGQDIRVGTPDNCKSERSTSAADRQAHEVIAVEDGVISNVGSYSVNLRSGGRIYKYLHLNMAKLSVAIGDNVQAGDTIGYVSNDFGGTPTVLHLHFEITQNNGNGGWDYVPPYTSLVASYERRENGPGEVIDEGDVAIASTPFVIPEDAIIIE